MFVFLKAVCFKFKICIVFSPCTYMHKNIKSPALFVSFLICLCLFAGCSRDPARKDYDRAEELLARGVYREALTRYERILEKHRSSEYAPKSQYRVAFIYDNYLNDRKRAMDEYLALYNVFPQSPEAKLAREAIAGIYSGNGDHARALEEYLWLLKQRPRDPARLRYGIAMEYFKMGDFKQARIEFTELLRAPQDQEMAPDIYMGLANSYYLEGDAKKAMETFDGVIDRFPKHRAAFDAKLGKADILEETGRTGEALAMLRALRGEYPEKEAVRSRIGLIERRLREGTN